MSLRIPLRSEKPGNVQISEKEFWRESCGKSSMSMNEDREWSEDDMDWSFKIQDEKQLEQCLQMKTDDIHWDAKAGIMRGKWLKRLMRYAVSETLWEKTDPVTEWIIQRDDWKLVKRAIRQKYIGKENADKLLEYAATVENTETDPRIVQLLLAER